MSLAVNGRRINNRRSIVNTAHYSQESENSEKEYKSEPKRNKSPIESIIERIIGENADSDNLLILALMGILIKEKADFKLIMALGYILL